MWESPGTPKEKFLALLAHGAICNHCAIKLMNGKALRKHSLHEKTAASVLLKLFITDAPSA